ncbi:MAG: PRC and DUF2382 domain-containing protein [Actinobacteria bacterium]|nr:PRC and DUF2382 domain-containing protein [Actinomycetota bacterium]
MTTQAEDLLGARVTGADGKVVGTVEQVFRDDVDGTPAWARVRAGKTGRFVPLGSSQVTAEGLTVPFDSAKILSGPDIEAGQHMSAAQAEELSRYYGLIVPAQQSRGPAAEESGEQITGQMPAGEMATGEAGEPDWLIRQEERLQVGKEMLETGRVRLHKYVDTESIEQPVHLYREEFEIERIPISGEEPGSGTLSEGVQEIVLREERVVLRKELVPVERVRLRTKRVETDSTVRDQVRRERIEVEPDQQFAANRPGDMGGRR